MATGSKSFANENKSGKFMGKTDRFFDHLPSKYIPIELMVSFISLKSY